MKPRLPKHLQNTLKQFVGRNGINNNSIKLNSNPQYYIKRTYIDDSNKKRKVLIKQLHLMKKKKEYISMITAYDYNQAKLADNAGIDIILVGDSLANVMLGYQKTNSLTLDSMIHHCKAVTNGTERAFVIGDMTFGTYLTVQGM